jgi:group I intron endonuclease
MGVIYLLESPNGKKYVGQTRQTFQDRMMKHKSAAKNLAKTDGCRYLNNAIREHGWDNFTKSVIWEGADDLLNEKEIALIAQYNTIAPNGYNLLYGGDAGLKSDDTKLKMKDSALKRDSKPYRKTEEAKNLPKYVGKWKNGYRITKHPQCSSKYFTEELTPEANLIKALEFLTELNEGRVVVIIQNHNFEKGLQRQGEGFRVRFDNGTKVITKSFTNKSRTKEENFLAATAYLQELKKTQQEGSETMRQLGESISSTSP